MITFGDPGDPIGYAKHCISSAEAIFRSYNLGIRVLSADGYRELRAQWAGNPDRLPHLTALEVLVTAQRCLDHLIHGKRGAGLLEEVARDFAILGRLEQGLADLVPGGVVDLARVGVGKKKQLADATDKAADVRRRIDRREGIIQLLIEHPDWSNTRLAKAQASAEEAAGTGGRDPRSASMTLLRKEGEKLRAEARARGG